MELQAKDVRNIEVLEEGMAFRNYTIICLDHINKEGRNRDRQQYYKVRCVCGRKRILSRSTIVYSNKHSCPHCNIPYPKYLKMGDKYGRLTIIGVNGNSMRRKDGGKFQILQKYIDMLERKREKKKRKVTKQ